MVLGFSIGSTIALEMAATAGFTGPLILTGASFSRKAESTMLEVLDALARVTGALPYAFMRSMLADAQAEHHSSGTSRPNYWPN